MNEVSRAIPSETGEFRLEYCAGVPGLREDRPSQSVETGNGCVIVTVKCEHCGRQWQVSKPDAKY